MNFHALKMHSLNGILTFAGFKTLDNMNDFDLSVFLHQAQQLDHQIGPKTEGQTIFLQYFHAIKKRGLDYATPNDVAPVYSKR